MLCEETAFTNYQADTAFREMLSHHSAIFTLTRMGDILADYFAVSNIFKLMKRELSLNSPAADDMLPPLLRDYLPLHFVRGKLGRLDDSARWE